MKLRKQMTEIIVRISVKSTLKQESAISLSMSASMMIDGMVDDNDANRLVIHGHLSSIKASRMAVSIDTKPNIKELGLTKRILIEDQIKCADSERAEEVATDLYWTLESNGWNVFDNASIEALIDDKPFSGRKEDV